jgi:hypothetical protein
LRRISRGSFVLGEEAEGDMVAPFIMDWNSQRQHRRIRRGQTLSGNCMTQPQISRTIIKEFMDEHHKLVQKRDRVVRRMATLQDHKISRDDFEFEKEEAVLGFGWSSCEVRKARILHRKQ